jgi:hypothetical protein
LFGRIWKILKSLFSLDSLNNSGLSVRNYSSIAERFFDGVRIAASFAVPSKNAESRRNRTSFSKIFRLDSLASDVVFFFMFQYFNLTFPNCRDFRHRPEQVFGGLALMRCPE